jgi:hypothetical protein
MKKHFSFTSFQEQLVQELLMIHRCGVGQHRRRSRGAALGRARRTLERLGYTDAQVDVAIVDVKDMVELELNATTEEVA